LEATTAAVAEAAMESAWAWVNPAVLTRSLETEAMIVRTSPAVVALDFVLGPNKREQPAKRRRLAASSPNRGILLLVFMLVLLF
jgi:hypothetical protein